MDNNQNENQIPLTIQTDKEVDPIVLEVGRAIIPFIQESSQNNQGNVLLSKTEEVRSYIKNELGITIPTLHIRDYPSLEENQYRILINGFSVAQGTVYNNYLLAIKSDDMEEGFSEQHIPDPIYGNESIWVPYELEEKALDLGYTVLDILEVMLTHFREMVYQYSYELLRRQDVHNLITKVAEKHPGLVAELEEQEVSFFDVQQVLKNFLFDQIPIKNTPYLLEVILDGFGDYETVDDLTSFVRAAFGKQILETYRNPDDQKVYILPLSEELENSLSVEHTVYGYQFAENVDTEQLIALIDNATQPFHDKGVFPVILTRRHPIRFSLSRLIERNQLDVFVINKTELADHSILEYVGLITPQ